MGLNHQPPTKKDSLCAGLFFTCEKTPGQIGTDIQPSGAGIIGNDVSTRLLVMLQRYHFLLFHLLQ